MIGAAVDFIRDEPLIFQILFWLSVAGLLVTALSWSWLSVRAWWLSRNNPPTETGVAAFNAQMIHIGPEAEIGRFSARDLSMQIGGGQPTIPPYRPPLPDTPEASKRLKEELRAVSQELYSFHDERRRGEPQEDFGHATLEGDAFRAYLVESQQASRAYDAETLILYRTLYEVRATYLYEEAKARGYGEPKLESLFWRHTSVRDIEEIAKWLGVTGERVVIAELPGAPGCERPDD